MFCFIDGEYVMINDQKLYDYLNQDVIENLMPINLDFVTAHGTLLPEWTIRFNQLNEESMYQELRFIIQELMVMQIDEAQRLNLMYEVTKVGQVLISKLHILYWNQAGLLNSEQQNALDRVLSIYYSMTIFYYSVWQRLSSKIDSIEPSGSSLSILKNFGKSNTTTPQDIIKRCIFSMMVLLKQSLLEKQIGYRQDTQVIWQYLNACYNFVQNYGWQSYSFDLNTLLNYNGKLSIEQTYRQCLLADLIQPYAYRRHDLLKLHTGLIEWADYLEVTSDPATKPFLYIDLQGSTGPKLLSTEDPYNPFSANSTALFINLQPILIKLTQLIGQANKPTSKQGQIRLANLVYPNLESILQVPTPYVDIHEPCQIVVGFHHIHFILAGKTSLDNLIHSHQLPERIRPAISTGKNFEKPSQAMLTGLNQQYRKLYFPYLYPHTDKTSHSLRTPTVTSINQFQVHSLIAIYGSDMKDNSWKFFKSD